MSNKPPLPKRREEPRLLERYALYDEIASGGMATVHVGRLVGAVGFSRTVAIKRLHPQYAKDPEFVSMLLDEARLAARIQHPNVVSTLDVVAKKGELFIVMDYVDGESFSRLMKSSLKAGQGVPVRIVSAIVCQALQGLHAAHEATSERGERLDVVHRDVSPQNVLVGVDGTARVIDFGVAKAASRVQTTSDGQIKGKIAYMSPEQLRTEPVDRRSDVFSCGVMLWEALTRRRFYEKSEDKFARLTDGQIPDVLQIRPDASKRLARICMRALAPNRDERYATADAMADELEDWLGSTTQHVTSRDVGSFLADKFAPTRQAIKEAIEEQLKKFRAQPDQVPISKLPVGQDTMTEMTDPPPPPHGYAATVPPGGMPPLNLPPLPPLNMGTNGAPNANGSAQHVWTSDGAPGVSAPPNVTAAAPKSGAQPKSFVPLAIVAAVGIVLLAGGVGIASIAKSKRKNDVTVASAGSAASLTGATTNNDNAVDIDFTIKASPANATISVDGQALEGNPINGKRPRDGAIHQVRIEAPGYEPREEGVSFSRSFLVTIELRPVGAAPPDPASTITVTTTTTATGKGGGKWWSRNQGGATGSGGGGATGKKGTPQNKGGLDTDNPYQ